MSATPATRDVTTRASTPAPALAVPSFAAGALAHAAAIPLPGAIARALDAGTSLAKSTGPEGKERLLTKHERDRLAALLPQLPAVMGRLAVVLETPASPIGSALVLRAVHARLTRLLAGEDVMPAIETFARTVATLDDATLRARASVLDLDSRVNTSKTDPLGRAARKGVIHAKGLDDTRADNDGMYQRYSSSCGPTVIHMMIAEADPILAFALHDAGLNAEGADTEAARFQAAVLAHHGAVGILTTDGQLWSRFRNALGRLRADTTVSKAGIEALEKYVTHQGRLTVAALEVASTLRARFDFPSAAELDLLRAHPIPARDEGIGFDGLLSALGRHVSAATGNYYQQTTPAGGFARGQAYRHVDAVARALARGIDVPVGLCEPSHWMLLTAVRGKKPERSFLMSDPFGGRTAWVTERDLKSGAFAARQFDLCIGKERGYIDCFFLPQ